MNRVFHHVTIAGFDQLRADHQQDQINDLELYIVNLAKEHDVRNFYLLKTLPGIGKILSLVILYEIHDISRFDRVQDFVSYCRLVKPGSS